jgi:hypothetical protein
LIIKTLIGVGWCRARNYAGGRGWTLNLPNLTPVNIARACAFVRKLYGMTNLDFTAVRLDAPEGIRHVQVADLQTLKVFPRGLVLPTIPVLSLIENASQIPREDMPKIESFRIIEERERNPQ